MGCGPSKLIKKDLDNGGNHINHVVSLKSSTYGVLNFDNEIQQQQQEIGELEEVINVWELMEDLEEDGFNERSLDSRKGVIENDVPSSLKFLNQSIVSPLKVMKLGGKTDGVDSGLGFPPCFSPSFDPELIALYEKELSEEEEEIKGMIENSKTEPAEIGKWDESHDSNEVVIYTTTLRGNQKTFEECNTVRSIIESHRVQMFERNVSMNTGLKEELRKLSGLKEEKVPLVFVEGKLIGGVEERVKKI